MVSDSLLPPGVDSISLRSQEPARKSAGLPLEAAVLFEVGKRDAGMGRCFSANPFERAPPIAEALCFLITLLAIR
jgi:hypothetical protein